MGGSAWFACEVCGAETILTNRQYVPTTCSPACNSERRARRRLAAYLAGRGRVGVDQVARDLKWTVAQVAALLDRVA